MATDNFWLNPYDEEEKERLRQHQLQMGVTPAPPYGPFGGGIGPGAYQGTMGMGTPMILPGEETINTTPVDPTSAGMAPLRELAGPTVNKFTPLGSDYTPQQLYTPVEELQQQNIPQNVIPITPTDTTLAGMATVPFTGMESYFEDGTKVAAGPSWGFNISPTNKSVGVTWGTTPNAQLPSDQTGGIIWPEKPTVQSVPMGIYEDLLSKKTLYEMGPGHPTVKKELIKTLEDQRNAVLNPGPTEKEVEAIIEKAISAPTGNLERIAIAKAAAKDKRASDLARQKQAAADKRAADRANAARQKSDAAARAKQRELAKKAFDALMVGRDRGEPSSAEINAAIEVMSGVDTFGSGNPFAERAAQDRASVAIDASRRGGGPF